MVVQTSLWAYADVLRDGSLGEQCLRVLKALRNAHMPLNDRMISMITGLPRFVVPDRRGKLLEMGYLVESHIGVDPMTHKKTKYWRNVT